MACVEPMHDYFHNERGEVTTLVLPKENVSNVTWNLVLKLIQRDELGKAKYGTTLDRTDLTHEQWLDHMTEELLDAAGYAQAAKRTGS